ncbi:MAG: methyl-accepting chemotaxis protein [Desulfovibrio sp.]|nr:MAG: methyl-accepting chemotaxis protein [Desulfovibrio sp.]
MLKHIPMKPKLIALFLLAGLAPLALMGWWATDQAAQSLMEKSYSQLESLRQVKKTAVERYFLDIKNQILTFSEDRMIIQAMQDFSAAFPRVRQTNNATAQDMERMRQELATYYTGEFSQEYQAQNNGNSPDVQNLMAALDQDSIILQYLFIRANEHPLGSKHLLDRPGGDSTRYGELHEQIHPIIRSYLEKFGYYDIFLVDPNTGDIVYSVFKELDYSTSLIDGPYADTNFGEAFRLANAADNKDAVILVDYECYTPSYEAAASFIASPIFDGDTKVGVLIFQMPIDRLNAIMSERAGLGESGETYLVGPDKLMRSDSFLDPANHSVRASFNNPDLGSVDTEATRLALGGESGSQVIVDYNGNPVLSAYAPVTVGENTWALLAEIDEAEVKQPIAALKKSVVVLGGIIGLVVAGLAFFVALSIARPLAKGARFAQAVAQGDLNARLDVKQRDEVGRICEALATIPANLKQVISQFTGMVDAIGTGKLTERGDPGQFEGAFAEIIAGSNTLAEVLISFLDKAPTPMMAIDSNFSVLYMNQAALGILGEEPSAVLGRRCHDFFQTGDCQTENCACGRAMASQGLIQSSTDAHPSGMDLDIDYTAVPIVDKDGNVAGAFEIIVDQTAIKTAQRKMMTLAEQAASIVERLASAADELSAQVEQSSHGAETQKQRAGETATAMEEMNSTVLEVARNASDAAENADSARNTADSGAAVVNKVVDSINQVQTLAENLKANMEDLGGKAESIGQVMTVITDIADQTNLLALNAAIEAARAGEAGRGFAVVADEVRKLAEKTMSATSEVGAAIEAIQAGAKTNADATDQAVAAVSDSTGLAEESGQKLGEIVAMVETSADQVRAIATASEEQSSASEEISRAVEEINTISTETAEAMVQSSKAIMELAQLARDLENLIEDLRS